jgi:FkbM family methyltransferase
MAPMTRTQAEENLVTGETTGLALARYELRRVAQTRRTFENWPTLLRRMVGEKLGRCGAELEFVTRGGVRITCPNVPGARLPLYEQYADDCYRLRELLAPLQGRPLQVFDIGAHIGSFATHIATLHRRARVECYEPSAQSAQYLRRNAQQNGFGGRITVHEVALADKEGTALFDDNDGGSVHNGLVRAERRLVDGADALAERHTVEVPTITFDTAVAAAPAPPQLVKMDCEGGEYPLVYASSPESWASVEVVVMEYHPVPGESWDELRVWLHDAGLDVVRHESDRPGLGTAWLARRTDDGSEGSTE